MSSQLARPTEQLTLSIVIKALNEEARIEQTIRSAMAAIEKVGGEVILADSASTDATVEIAQRFPIKIVQLAVPSQRCCGIGPELGFQHSRGAYIWIVDGDMILNPDFVTDALDLLEKDPKLGAVGGLVRENEVSNMEFARRLSTKDQDQPIAASVHALEQGGIYRRAAIEDIGYFSDRNLHSYEEFDLGSRLRAKGWALSRISTLSCDHYGHSDGSYVLLWKRFRSRYAFGSGEVLRAAAEQGRMKSVVAELRVIRLWVVNAIYWSLLMLYLAFAPRTLAALGLGVLLLLLPVAIAYARKRSLRLAVFTVASWNVFTLGFLLGIIWPRTPPLTVVDRNVVPALS